MTGGCLRAGLHIRVYRGGYWHHGITIGNGQIVHFAGEPMRNKASATIRQTSIREFAANGERVELVNSGHYAYPADEVVERALELLNKDGYNLFINNCEHFASYCTSGHHRSQQIKDTYEDIVFASDVPLIPDLPIVGVPASFVVGAARIGVRKLTQKLLYYKGARETTRFWDEVLSKRRERRRRSPWLHW